MDTTDAPQIIEHIHKPINFTPYDTRWVPFSARFVAMGIHANAKGALNVYQLNNGDLETLVEAKTANGVKCGTFGASSIEERHIATGDHAGKLVIYDLENTDKPIFSQQAHVSIINAIDGCGGLDVGYGAPEIVTGGRDGCVRLWDPRVQEPVLALEPGEGQPARDCWTVAFGNSFSDEDRCIVAGYDNGDVKLFDLRANAMRYETNVANGVTNIEFDRKDIEMNKMTVSNYIFMSCCCRTHSIKNLYPIVLHLCPLFFFRSRRWRAGSACSTCARSTPPRASPAYPRRLTRYRFVLISATVSTI